MGTWTLWESLRGCLNPICGWIQCLNILVSLILHAGPQGMSEDHGCLGIPVGQFCLPCGLGFRLKLVNNKKRTCWIAGHGDDPDVRQGQTQRKADPNFQVIASDSKSSGTQLQRICQELKSFQQKHWRRSQKGGILQSPNPKGWKRRKTSLNRPGPIFQLFGVYCIASALDFCVFLRQRCFNCWRD